MYKTNILKSLALCLSVVFLAISTSSSHAEIVNITFSTVDATNEAEVIFSFNTSGGVNDGFVQIDQVATGTPAFDIQQNNESIGRELSLVPGSLTAIGEVALNDSLMAGMSFSTAAVNAVTNGTAFAGTGTTYVGFVDNDDNVGFFQVDFFDGSESNIIRFSGGRYGMSGASFSVSAVPEPSCITLLALSGLYFTTKRRRS